MPTLGPRDPFQSAVRLRQTLRGHDKAINKMAWSPNGHLLASPSSDGTIGMWDGETGELIRTLKGHSAEIKYVAWSPVGEMLASGSIASNDTIKVWDTKIGEVLFESEPRSSSSRSLAWSPKEQTLASGFADGTLLFLDLNGERRILRQVRSLRSSVTRVLNPVTSLAWSPDGSALASGNVGEADIKLWNAEDGTLSRQLVGHTGFVTCLAWSPDGRIIASGAMDNTIRLWDAETGKQTNVLEGHTALVLSVSFSPDSGLLASKSADSTVRIWLSGTWSTLAQFEEPSSLFSGLSFHPKKRVLATLGEENTTIRIWDLNLPSLASATSSASSQQYVNAKVVLVGDSGVGKSGLALVLSGQTFAPTESTHNRHVWTQDNVALSFPDGHKETRETLLWDLAGQHGYRLIHQLHLNEVTVALVVFDARNESDPFSGVRHWARALRQSRALQGNTAPPLKQFLVAARVDRGAVGVSRQRVDSLIQELHFDNYFETSAKEGWQIEDLSEAIRQAIDWDALPKVSSPELFKKMKDFLIEEKQGGQLLSTNEGLYRSFLRSDKTQPQTDELRAQFETCIGRLASRDLIQQLSFGNLVLLQPEMLDSYATTIVNAAKQEPDGLGSIAEEDVREGRFRMPIGERIRDAEQEKLLLIATVEDLLRHEIALRQQTDQGPLIVFPSQLTRENPDLPDPEGKAVIFGFEGPLLNIYATLIVRLSHSGLFRRKDMWKNATTFAAKVGGECGVFLRELDEGRGELTLFFDAETSEETCYQFEEYVHTHLGRRALSDSIVRRRVFVCEQCNEVITDTQAQRRRARGHESIDCPVCDSVISLQDGIARIKRVGPSIVPEIDRAADDQRESDLRLLSAVGEMRTRGIRGWIGSASPVAIVCTNIVSPSSLEKQTMDDATRVNFGYALQLLSSIDAYLVKATDSFVIAFRTATAAFRFALFLHRNTGNESLPMRSGIHIGLVDAGNKDDQLGAITDYTNRIAQAPALATGIWISTEGKVKLDQEGLVESTVSLTSHPSCKIKGSWDTHSLWSVAEQDMDGIRFVQNALGQADHEFDFQAHLFDVFLAHNSQDKAQVEIIAQKLRERGLSPWLDKEQVPPGRWFQDVLQSVIPHVRSAAIFIGIKGLGRWQAMELRSFISQCVEANLPVIPVLLPGVDKIPNDLLFLKELHWVKFSGSDEHEALDNLEWGITGRHPNRRRG